jgi:hypothetical protein
LAAMMRERPSVLLMTGDTVLQGHIDRILAFAAEHRLPVVHQLRENAEAGRLMSYGLWPYGVTGTCLAIAHKNPMSSRAIATTTWLACFPRVIKRR